MIKKPRGKIAIYKPKSGEIRLSVKLEEETVWLSLSQIAFLFNTDKSGISRHIKNILKSGELDRKSTVAKIATVQKEGQRRIKRIIDYYNLDMVLSIGYRVNSHKATQFRVWATKILKNHLVKGFTLNRKRLEQQRNKRLAELQRTVGFLQEVISKKQLESDETAGLLRVITDYANTWALLEKYDGGKLEERGKKVERALVLDYKEAKVLIIKLKRNLIKKKEASRFFAVERDEGLSGILGNLNQELAGSPVYATLEDKAAHLLYFVIKDHVFIDGNKRIAALLFISFLYRNNYLFNKKGEKKFNDNALVALTLLVAESKMKDKDMMIKLITNLLFN